MNSSLKPHEPFVLFVDRSLGKVKIAAALRAVGVQVEIHDDHFPPNAKDEDWLREVGLRGWVVITKDQKIRYRAIERQALMKAGVRTFVLTAHDLQAEEMAQIFVQALPRMRRLVERTEAPFIITLTRGGTLKLVLGGKGKSPRRKGSKH